MIENKDFSLNFGTNGFIQKAISEISLDQAIQTAETILSLAKVSDIARILD